MSKSSTHQSQESLEQLESLLSEPLPAKGQAPTSPPEPLRWRQRLPLLQDTALAFLSALSGKASTSPPQSLRWRQRFKVVQGTALVIAMIAFICWMIAAPLALLLLIFGI